MYHLHVPDVDKVARAADFFLRTEEIIRAIGKIVGTTAVLARLASLAGTTGPAAAAVGSLIKICWQGFHKICRNVIKAWYLLL